jgi:WD40 repeat protein
MPLFASPTRSIDTSTAMRLLLAVSLFNVAMAKAKCADPMRPRSSFTEVLAPRPYPASIELRNELLFEELAPVPGEIRFSADGSLLAACNVCGDVRIWNAETADQVASLAVFERRMLREEIRVAFSPTNAGMLALGLIDGRVCLYDVVQERPIRTLHRTAPTDTVEDPFHRVIVALTFSADGNSLLALSGDNVLCRWDSLSGTLLSTVPIACAESYRPSLLACSPDGRQFAVAAGGESGEVLRYDAVTGKRLSDCGQKNRSAVTDLAYSPDGKLLTMAFSGAAAGSDLA